MADILTRREARQQAKQNRGYNRGQFQLAMANAKNALRRNSDLRGRDLRQTARRMVAGMGEYSSEQNAPVLTNRNQDKINTIVPIQGLAVPTVQTKLVGTPLVSDPTADLTGVGNFNNAFAAANRAGLKTFIWNGKSYGTRKASTPEEIAAWRKAKGISTSVSSNTNPASATAVVPTSTTSAVNQPEKDLISYAGELSPSVVLAFRTRPQNQPQGGTLKPIVTANPKTDINLYRKQLMDRWTHILSNPSEFSPMEISYARQNLPLYQKRYGNQ